jgi:hypothetical protein
MKTNYFKILPILITSVLIIPDINSQEKLDDKIGKIEGAVEKITITADGNEYVFEGDDAEKLFKKIKRNQVQSFVWNSSGDSVKKIIILDATSSDDDIEVEDSDENVLIIKTDKDVNDIDDGITKKVNVVIEDGNKKVTVTTKENGEEKTEVYEGDEAEEYLEKLDAESDELDILIEKENGKKVKKIIIETEKGGLID